MSDVAAPVVNTSADMLAGVDMSSFNTSAESESVPEETTESTEQAEEAPAEAAPLETPEVTEPEPAEPEEPEQPEEPQQAAATDKLPEGVRKIKDRQGNEGLFVTPERWKEIYEQSYRPMQEMSEMIGEPLTSDALQYRHRALMANEQMQNDLMSGDPALQSNVFKYFADTFAQARANGDIGHNPMVPLAEAFYNTLRDTDQEAYASLRFKQAADLVEEMYDAAAQAKDRNLYLSASHVARALGMKYRPDGEFEKLAAQPQDPSASLRAENERLRQESVARAAADRKSQYDYFFNQTKQSVQQAVYQNAVLPTIPPEAVKAWEKFPTQYEANVLKPINQKVAEIIGQDKGFTQVINQLNRRAEMATTAQARQAIHDEIVERYENRARLAARNVAPQILREAAEKLKTDNQKAHQRHQAAAQQRGPKGPQNPVPRSLVPASIGKGQDGYATEQSMLQDLARVFPNGV